MSGYISRLADRAIYLIEGICTQDIDHLSNSDQLAVSSLFLNPKGRILFDSIISKVPDFDAKFPMFYIETHKFHSKQLEIVVEKYSFRKKVTLHNLSEDLEITAIYSEDVLPEDIEGKAQKWAFQEGLLEIPEKGFEENSTTQGYTAFIDPRNKMLGSRTIGAKEAVEVEAGIISKPTEFYNNFRRLCGICEGPGVEGQIPHVLNFHKLNAISFNKGCYVGQELVARTQTQGVLRTVSLPFLINPDNKIAHFTDSIHTPVWAIDDHFKISLKNLQIQDKNGNNIGEIIETDKNIGIAKVKIDSLEDLCLLSDGTPLFFFRPAWLSELFTK